MNCACSASSHCLNQCWLIIKFANFSKIGAKCEHFCDENASENVVCKMPRCVKSLTRSSNVDKNIFKQQHDMPSCVLADDSLLSSERCLDDRKKLSLQVLVKYRSRGNICYIQSYPFETWHTAPQQRGDPRKISERHTLVYTINLAFLASRFRENLRIEADCWDVT